MRKMKNSGIEWVGEIPCDWEVVRNKNAFTCSKNLVGEDCSKIQLLSLTTKGIKTKDINNPEGKLPDSFDTYQFVKKNEMVMCLFDLDCSAVFSGLSPFDGMISPAYKVLSCIESIFPRYADYWFKFVSFDRKFNHYAKNIRFTIGYDDFSALPILLPSISEQKKIANYLDKKCNIADRIISNQQIIIEKLSDYKFSLITETVTNGINGSNEKKESGINYIGSLPKDWKVMKFKYIFDKKIDNRGRTPNTLEDDDGIPLVEVASLGERHPDLTKVKKYISKETYKKFIRDDIEKGDILVTTVGATIGKSSIVDNANMCIAQNIVGYRVNEEQIPSFWYYYFQSKVFQDMFAQYDKGNTINNVKISNMEQGFVVVAPKYEQEAIVKFLDKVTAKIDAEVCMRRELIDKIIEYKKSLIYEVVTGKKELV